MRKNDNSLLVLTNVHLLVTLKFELSGEVIFLLQTQIISIRVYSYH